MNLVESLCKKLGVSVNEEWKGNDGHDYFINKEGFLIQVKPRGLLNRDCEWVKHDIQRVLSGELQPVQYPPNGTSVFIVDLAYDDNVVEYIWDINNEKLVTLFDKGQVFNTYTEAFDVAKQMVNRMQHINNDSSVCKYCGKGTYDTYLGGITTVPNKTVDYYNQNNIVCELSIYHDDLDIYVYDIDNDMVSSELFEGELEIAYCPFCGRYLKGGE